MRMRLIVLPMVALAAGLYFWKTTEPLPQVPACTWRSGSGTDIRQGQNYDDLIGDTPIRLSFTAFKPRYVYVFSHSAEDGTLLLFPSSAVKSDCNNPLPAGRTVIPGAYDGKAVAWTTRRGIQAITTYMALASSEPIDDLEQLLPKLRMWSNTVFPDHSMSVTKFADTEVIGKAHEPIPAKLLRTTADIGNTEPNPNGPMKPVRGHPGIFSSSWKIKERNKGKPAKPPGETKNK